MDVWIAVYVSQALDQRSFFGQILLHLILKRCVFWLLVTEKPKKLFLQVIPSTWHGEKNMVRITNGTLQKWGGIHRILPINSHLKNSELEDHFLEQLHPKCEVFSAVWWKVVTPSSSSSFILKVCPSWGTFHDSVSKFGSPAGSPCCYFLCMSDLGLHWWDCSLDWDLHRNA